MNKGILITICFGIIFCSCKRQTLPVDYYGLRLTSFKMNYGGAGDEVINSIIQSSDGNYSFTGTTTTLTNGGQDMYIGQTDQNGALLWSKAIGGASSDGGCDLIETPDHNLLFVGYSKSYNATNFYQVFLVKTDFQGNVIWQQTLADGSSAYKIIPSKNKDGYILTGGATGLFSLTGRSVYIAKIGYDGSLIWSNSYSNGNDEIGKSICYDNAGNLMILASPQIENNSNDEYLLKLSDKGDSIWTKTFANNGYEEAGSIISTANNLYMVGSSGNMTNPLGITSFNKMDTSGNIIMPYIFQSSFPYSGNCLIQCSDKNFLIAGAKADSSNISADYLMKLDNNGNQLWTKSFRDSLNYSASIVVETNDSYLIGGSVTNTTGSLDGIIIKVKK